MKSLIAICLFTFGNLLVAQSPQSGLILPVDDNENFNCCVYISTKGFNVYSQPNGKLIGSISNKLDANSLYFKDNLTKKQTELNPENLYQVNYDMTVIPFFERKDGFIKILTHKENYWLKESEVKSESFEIVEWQKFLVENGNELLGFYANEPGLNLREKPSTDSKILMTLRTDNQQIIPTNEHKGLWTKVKVIITKEHVCMTDLSEQENFVEVVEGWVKILDDGGAPNVHFYAKGC